MPTLAIMNYESAKIELIDLPSAIVQQYAENLDDFVYGKMGYKQTNVYYMVADNIDVVKKRYLHRLKI